MAEPLELEAYQVSITSVSSVLLPLRVAGAALSTSKPQNRGSAAQGAGRSGNH